MVKVTVTIAAVMAVCAVLADVGSSRPVVSFPQHGPFLRQEGSAERELGFRPAGNNIHPLVIFWVVWYLPWCY
ncbi:hypothetical protein JG687_00012631 [Phytophthora cactorum]|uniref:RxLR effector protein n=1 Tax=Phytophthora cactorum TaxID=29920 RepID=A0A8T1U3R9_9STRA|nr:hypothetical protein JG687_00012631 [Phytophthora cactorum]